jgi:transposase
MMKHDYEKKKRCIELISKKHYSIRSVAKELGVAKSLVQRWWKIYEYHGMKGLMAKPRTYDGKFKVYAVEYMCNNNLSACEAAAQLGIPNDATLLTWKQTFLKSTEGHRDRYIVPLSIIASLLGVLASVMTGLI